MASVIGRDLREDRVLLRGLQALEAAGIPILAAQQPSRNVDVQFLLSRDDLDRAIKVLHAEFIETPKADHQSRSEEPAAVCRKFAA
jgi:aspartate kinase